MEQIKAFWTDFKTFMWVRYFNCRDLLRTIFRYYRKPKFALCDLASLLTYFFKSPYRIGREHNPDEPYGETPLITLEAIINHCPVHTDDVAYELGSGRGRACFFLASFYRCKTIGIENIPTFVERAQKIASYFHIDNVQFRLEDILTADIHDATWVYLFGTALPDDTIVKLCKRFEALKPGAKIITISYPLTAYSTSDKFQLLDTIDVEFAWGSTQAFIHQIM